MNRDASTIIAAVLKSLDIAVMEAAEDESAEGVIMKVSQALAKRCHDLEFRKVPPRPWKIGDRIRYMRSLDWGPSRGTEGIIMGFNTVPAEDPKAYQVFYTSPIGREGSFWTTPSDIEWVDG